METPPLTSVILGFLFTFYALPVETQSQNEPASPLFFTNLPPPPPSPSPSPPPPPPPPISELLSFNTPPPRCKMNIGKKIGLLFVGIAAIFQIGVVGYLFFKRKHLLKVKGRHENCRSSEVLKFPS